MNLEGRFEQLILSGPGNINVRETINPLNTHIHYITYCQDQYELSNKSLGILSTAAENDTQSTIPAHRSR